MDERLIEGFRRAQQAGDVETAKLLGAEIRRQQSAVVEQTSAAPSEPAFRGGFLPVSSDAEGNVSFDSDAGIVGLAKRVVTAPGEVLKGELNPFSEGGRLRALEFAATASPMSAALRATPSRVPGVRFKREKAKTPSRPALQEATKAGFKEVDKSGLEVTGGRVKQFADDTVKALDEQGFIAENAEQTHALLRRLQKIPNEPGAEVTARVQSLDVFRRRLNEIAGREGPDAGAAVVVLKKLDQLLDNLLPADIVLRRSGGAAPSSPEAVVLANRAIKALKDARGNAAAGFRSDRITGLEKTVERRAAAANSGKNVGNTIRQRLTSLLESAKNSRGFSKQEIAAIDQIIKGTATTNTLRRLSNLLGGGGGLGQTLVASGLGVGGAAIGGPAGAGVGVAGGMLAGSGTRSLANALTKRQLRTVDDMVRQRSPLHQNALQQLPITPVVPEGRHALARALMALPLRQEQRLPKTRQELIEFLQRGGA